MYGEFSVCFIFQLVDPIEAFYIPSPPECDGPHNDIIFYCVSYTGKVITLQTYRKHTIAN